MSEIKYTPTIVVPGIGQSKVELLDKNGNKAGMVWPMSINAEQYLDRLKAPLMKTLLFRNDKALSDALVKILDEVLEPLSTNPDGTLKNPYRVVTYPVLSQCTPDEKRYIYKMVPLQKLSAIIGEENLYFFAFNSFGDTYAMAKDLDEFIQKVKAETNSEKVNLVPVSLGGALTTAYLDEYGYKNDIKRVMYFVAAVDGSMLIADILAKRLDKSKIGAVIEMLSSKKNAEMFEQKLLPMLPGNCFDNVFNKCLDKLVEKAIAGCPMMWSVVPCAEYAPLASKLIKSGELKAKTDKYNDAQRRYKEIFENLRKQGTEFFAICCYNRKLLEIAGSANLSSDGIIHINSAGLFTKAAPAGEKLAEGGRLSPDGNIDASTGLLPDATWYFKDQFHDSTAYNDTALSVAARVLSDDSFTSVFSDENLPQFGVASDNRK